jgi:hypothetical protein
MMTYADSVNDLQQVCHFVLSGDSVGLGVRVLFGCHGVWR